MATLINNSSTSDTMLRLEIIKLVMQYDSQATASNPFAKANAIYEWVKEITPKKSR